MSVNAYNIIYCVQRYFYYIYIYTYIVILLHIRTASDLVLYYILNIIIILLFITFRVFLVHFSGAPPPIEYTTVERLKNKSDTVQQSYIIYDIIVHHYYYHRHHHRRRHERGGWAVDYYNDVYDTRTHRRRLRRGHERRGRVPTRDAYGV